MEFDWIILSSGIYPPEKKYPIRILFKNLSGCMVWPARMNWLPLQASLTTDSHTFTHTDLNTWIAGSQGFAYSSMRATGNPSAAILLQSKHWIDTLTSAHVSAWNATGDRFYLQISWKSWKTKKKKKKKMEKFPRSSRLLNIYWNCKKKKKSADVN